MTEPFAFVLPTVPLGYPEDSIGRLMTPDYVKVVIYFSVAAVVLRGTLL